MAPAESLFLPGFAPGDALAEGDTAGDAWCQQHGPAERRPHGITLTPAWLVQRMLALADAAAYDTIVDIGAGTGRFAIAAALANPQARVLAVEDHPQMLALLRQRKPWHWLAMRAPPAAMVSDMGRRPPVFRANPQQVSFLNIAHWLYPLQPLAADVLPPMLAGARAALACRPADPAWHRVLSRHPSAGVCRAGQPGRRRIHPRHSG